MYKTSAQESYLNYLRAEFASKNQGFSKSAGSALTCGAARALAHLKSKKKKATIVKEAQGYEISPEVLEALEYQRQLAANPMLIDVDTQRRLLEHNQRALGAAGGILGAGVGGLGGAGLGAGIGALVSKAGKRLPGAGWGALAGAGAGGLLGALTGPGIGKKMAPEATEKDLALLNQLAEQKVMNMGLSPFGMGSLEGMKARATFGKETGDPRAFALEEFYRNLPQGQQ